MTRRLRGRARERAVAALDARRQERREPRRTARAAPASSSRPAVRHQHRGGGAAERLRRRLRDGVERRGTGERLAEHGCDPVEAALHARLARCCA